MRLKAPFPWFGGKSRAADLIWPRFGDVSNYIEPFAGSLAVLLARPDEFPPRVETVNDKDAYLSNFWRAVQADPEAVAHYADWPVNEADLHARHRWLVNSCQGRMRKVKGNPHYYDAKVAGWWVWGQCMWIGSGWCARPEWTGRTSAGRRSRGVHTDEYAQRPDLTNDGRGALAQKTPQADRGGRGVLSPEFSRMGDVLNQQRRPQLTGNQGVIALPQKRPMAVGNGQGAGVHSLGVSGWQKRMDMKRGGGRGVHSNGVRRPNMGGAGGGQGVHAPRLTKGQVPDLSGSRGATGRGIHATAFDLRSGGLFDYMHALALRLRRVRVCCGDWSRVLTPSVTTYIGVTGVLLDPPYQHDLRSICYAQDEDISHKVREWAIAHGDDPQLRIVLCGYDGEHEMPKGWTVAKWKAGGGYGRSARGKANRTRERLFFSPHCLPDERHPLLTSSEGVA